MSRGQNGSAYLNGDGRLVPLGAKHNGKDISGESGWTTSLDLALILVPAAILMISGERYEKSYLAALLLVTILFLIYKRLHTSKVHVLRVLGSFVYSSVFPFTVSVAASRAHTTSSSHIAYDFVIACVTMFVLSFNPPFANFCQWAAATAIISPEWYLPTQLYMATFEAISNTASTSFNFEEVSLIATAITHILLYITESGSVVLPPHEIFLPALTFGMLIAISPAIPLLQRAQHSPKPMTLVACSYCTVMLSILLGVRPWLIAELSEDPIIWVLKYMTLIEGYELRLVIVLWWIAVLAFGIIVPIKFFTTASDHEDKGESLNKRRKFFHGIVVLLFIPSLNLDSHFTSIAMSLATSLFLLAEVVRHYKVPPFGHRLGEFFSIFTDERDSRGPLVVSHIFLLVGCATPVWMSLYGSNIPTNSLPIEGFSGVLCLGCGDAMVCPTKGSSDKKASIIGKKYGRRRWPRTRKTVEGTVAFAIAVILGAFVTTEVLPIFPYFTSNLTKILWDKFLISTILTALLEAMSLQNDNLVIPVYMWVLLRLWNVNGR